jgi:outer membrane lipoprotein SlyB
MRRSPLLPAIAAALALAACASAPVGTPVVTSGPAQRPPVAGVPAAPTACGDCGTVVHIETVAASKPSGPVLGGIVGGVAGRPVPGQLTHNVYVRMDDGRKVVVRRDELGGLRENQRVRVVGGRLLSL